MAAQASVARYDVLLAESRDLLRDRMCEVVRRMLDGADALLGGLADKATDKDAQKRFRDARDMAVRNRDIIESQFKQRFVSELQKRTNKAKKVAQSIASFSLDDLALVEEQDLEQTLRFNDLAARISRHCESELAALDQRARVLLGDASLESEDNPFGPQVFCDAFKVAGQKVDCPVEIRTLFIRLVDEPALDAIRGAYQQVNDLLVANQILPKIRYGISKNAESKTPAPAAAPAPAAPAAGDKGKAPAPPAANQDMFTRLAQMLAPAGGAGAGGGAPGMGVGGAPLVQGPELMGSLTQLQIGNLAALGEAAAELGPILAEAGNLKNVLHQLKSSKIGAGMSQVDTTTLDIVALLFDELFDDPKIPIALKGLIGHLQLPMLKVAIADKELFSSKTHPARQLLDALGQLGLRLPAGFGEAHQLFPRLQSFIRELVDGFQEKMEIFDKVRAELEEIIVEVDARVANEMEPAQKQLQQGERLALAKTAAEEEIRKRVAGATNLPRPIVRFLALQWIKHLVAVGGRDGKDSAAWKDAVQTMDTLMDSITPKPTQEERRAVARVIPGLLKRLKDGVAESGIEDAVSSAFFAELMKCHTEVIRDSATASTTRDPRVSMTQDPRAAAAQDPRASTPKDPRTSAQKDPRAAEEAVDLNAPVELKNPFGEGKVTVAAVDLDIRLPSAMVVGAWVQVLGDDGATPIPARLHYVSPMGSHFLFVDRQGVKVFEGSRSALAQRLRLGEIGLLGEEPDASLFDRSMEGVLDKLGAQSAR